MNAYVIGVVVALLSFAFSALIATSYDHAGWQLYASLAVVDFIFVAIFSHSNISNEKARWICSLLAISFLASFVSCLFEYSHHHEIMTSSYVAWFIDSYYTVMSGVISALIITIALLGEKLMWWIDDMLWPRFANNFRFNFDIWRIHNAKKGAFK
jgi:hypothetical protein